MKVQRWLFFFVGIFMLFLVAGCSEKASIDASVSIDQQTDIENDVSILNDEQLTVEPVELVEWQKAVGVWEDENGRGYTMQASVNESETDMLFSISFAPHGGVFLDWVLPCKLDGEILHYDKGVMSFMEMLPSEDEELMFDSSVEKELTGSFSFDSNRDILIWYDGSNEYGDSINFIRSQSSESEPIKLDNGLDEMMINGIPYAVADADGWGDAWQIVAEIIRNGTDIYFKEAEEDPSLYGSGNAWDDVTVEGITYEMASKHGWGDVWWEVVDHFGSDYDSYNGEGYSNYFEQESDFNTTLSNAELIQINDPISVQLANEWKNEYNQSASRDFRISNVLAQNSFPTIERHQQLATVVTEVEFWFVKQGGSPAGSVYTVVIIDSSNGDVLFACITA